MVLYVGTYYFCYRSSGHYSEIMLLHFEGDWKMGCLLGIYVQIDDAYRDRMTGQHASSETKHNNDDSNRSSTNSRSYNRFQKQRQSQKQLL